MGSAGRRVELPHGMNSENPRTPITLKLKKCFSRLLRLSSISVLCVWLFFFIFADKGHAIAKSSPSPKEVENYVRSESIQYGVDPKIALFIVGHESNFDPTRIGDDGISIGAWQINIKAHPNITKAEALDLAWSTKWSLKQLKEGHAKIWSTYRFCKKLYGTCP